MPGEHRCMFCSGTDAYGCKFIHQCERCGCNVCEDCAYIVRDDQSEDMVVLCPDCLDDPDVQN